LPELTKENAGCPAKVQGTILECRKLSNGSILLTLEQEGAKLPVFVPCWVVEDRATELCEGETLRASGWLQLYNGEIELKVVDPTGLCPIEDA